MKAPHMTWNAVPLPPPCSKPELRPQALPPLDASSDGIVDVLDEELYWARYFRTEPGYDPLFSFQEYAPAYRLGIAYRLARGQRTWDDCEDELRYIWELHACSDYLPWERARGPARAAWTRVHNALSWRH
jgi:hypothetical protein